MQFKKTILDNGLTLITAPMKDSPSVTALVMVKVGSKYETKEINGLSHFFEHMCFKGTEKRPTAGDISRELDGIGSQHNAFTTQEFTGYYAKAHPKYLDQIMDIVSDMYLNPTFSEKEIEKEKGVIKGEIDMYEDLPHHLVHHVFMELLYGDQPAGWRVLGTKEILDRIKREDFLNYRKDHYIASETIVIVSGNIDEQLIADKVRTLFKGIRRADKTDKIAVQELQSKPNIQIKHKDTDQTHLIIGVRTFDSKDKRNFALRVLNVVLGGGMSSRLFQKLREEMGVGYYVRSNTDEFTDHGYLAVSAGVDTSRIEEVVTAILNEMKKLAVEEVPEQELKKAKDYFVGNTYLGLESSDSLGEYYAIQEILSDEILTPEEFSEKIQGITAQEIMTLAKEIMRDDKLNMAIVGNIKDPAILKDIFHF